MDDRPTSKIIKKAARRVNKDRIRELEAANARFQDELDKAQASFAAVADLAERALGIIFNVARGDLTRETVEWQRSACYWRDDYHRQLSSYLKTKYIEE